MSGKLVWTDVRDARPHEDGREKWLSDGGGLSLKVRFEADGEISKTWVYRYGRNHTLGKYPDMSLSDARTARDIERGKRKNPTAAYDPVSARRAAKLKLKTEREQARVDKTKERHTLEVVFNKVITIKLKTWKDPDAKSMHEGWLANHVPRQLRESPVEDITENDIVDRVLAPLEGDGTSRPKIATARNLQAFLSVVFKHAIRRGWRINRDDPAQWKDALEHRLELAWMKNRDVNGHAALQWEDAPALYQLAVRRDTMADRALRLQMLCHLRPHNVLQAVERDLANRKPGPFDTEVWTIPAEKMKVKRRRNRTASPHDVYLNAPSIRILDEEMKLAPVVLKGFDPRFTRVWQNKKAPLTEAEFEAIRNAPPEMFTSILAVKYDRSERYINQIRSGEYDEKWKRGLQTERAPSSPEDRVFSGPGKDGNIADTAVWRAMKAILRSMEQPFVSRDRRPPVPHGLRGTFETFAQECTVFKDAVISASMAHGDIFARGNRHERNERRMMGIYFHGSFEEDRAALSQIWGEYVTTGAISAQWSDRLTSLGKTYVHEQPKLSAEVLKFSRRRAS
jgi:Arm DNA-binding domain